mmetsp:Transcript_81371/g.215965  ORF Transcript_81371/g.215965 Transcript_81371/m.215965 type:complete len:709 (-) Transcript_81371:185-2311(-)
MASPCVLESTPATDFASHVGSRRFVAIPVEQAFEGARLPDRDRRTRSVTPRPISPRAASEDARRRSLQPPTRLPGPRRMSAHSKANGRWGPDLPDLDAPSVGAYAAAESRGQFEGARSVERLSVGRQGDLPAHHLPGARPNLALPNEGGVPAEDPLPVVVYRRRPVEDKPPKRPRSSSTAATDRSLSSSSLRSEKPSRPSSRLRRTSRPPEHSRDCKNVPSMPPQLSSGSSATASSALAVPPPAVARRRSVDLAQVRSVSQPAGGIWVAQQHVPPTGLKGELVGKCMRLDTESPWRLLTWRRNGSSKDGSSDDSGMESTLKYALRIAGNPTMELRKQVIASRSCATLGARGGSHTQAAGREGTLRQSSSSSTAPAPAPAPAAPPQRQSSSSSTTPGCSARGMPSDGGMSMSGSFGEAPTHTPRRPHRQSSSSSTTPGFAKAMPADDAMLMSGNIAEAMSARYRGVPAESLLPSHQEAAAGVRYRAVADPELTRTADAPHHPCQVRRARSSDAHSRQRRCHSLPADPAGMSQEVFNELQALLSSVSDAKDRRSRSPVGRDEAAERATASTAPVSCRGGTSEGPRKAFTKATQSLRVRHQRPSDGSSRQAIPGVATLARRSLVCQQEDGTAEHGHGRGVAARGAAVRHGDPAASRSASRLIKAVYRGGIQEQCSAGCRAVVRWSGRRQRQHGGKVRKDSAWAPREPAPAG